MNNKIDNLKNALKGAESRVRTIEREIEDIEVRKVLPVIKKKYEGKYFIYMNSFDGVKKWPMYLFVSKVVGINEFECYCFQTDKHGKTDIEVKMRSGQYLFQTKINRAKYLAAFRRMRAITDFARRTKK